MKRKSSSHNSELLKLINLYILTVYLTRYGSFTGSKGLLQLGGILVAVVVVGGGVYIYVSQKKKKADK